MQRDPKTVLISPEVLSVREQSIFQVACNYQSIYDGLDDSRYGHALLYYVAFTENHSVIDPDLSQTLIIYNRYYWFQKFRSLYFQHVGYNAGLEQQAFKIFEYAIDQSGLDIDMQMIDAIDKLIE